ncbi:hypothetical protein I7I48_06982 [Histoplasma ohiense]|nr:hypothetical protein I7I48_06982 [Histoplasma ohiense (nom. inval.)]
MALPYQLIKPVLRMCSQTVNFYIMELRCLLDLKGQILAASHIRLSTATSLPVQLLHIAVL